MFTFCFEKVMAYYRSIRRCSCELLWWCFKVKNYHNRNEKNKKWQHFKCLQRLGPKSQTINERINFENVSQTNSHENQGTFLFRVGSDPDIWTQHLKLPSCTSDYAPSIFFIQISLLCKNNLLLSLLFFNIFSYNLSFM
jgi:hypothetical protein